MPGTYICPAETGFYYLQSRYYDTEIERFLNADSYLSTGQSFLGHNAFAYCGNNPVNREDADGDAWETVIDILSLGYSVLEVIENPKDGRAWAGFAGDLADVLIPFVCGIGEATRAVSAMAEVAGVVDDVHDTAKSLDIAKIATTGTSNQIGKIGEQLAGINAAAKVPIEINGRVRIPDALTNEVLTEVKNVKYISNTAQLRDFATYANTTGRKLELYVRPTTKVSKSVIAAGWEIKYLWKE